MAKANWIKVNPSSGSGNGSVSVSSTAAHTGRVVRTSFLTWKAANVADIVRNVNQAGKPEYVDISDNASADKVGGSVTIQGTSNSKRLTFSLGTGDLNIALPSTYLANSAMAQSGKDISGDPGASAEYIFSITISVPANDTISSMSRQIIVTDEAGHKDTCTLTLASGDAYVTIAAGDIELDWQGSAVSVAVQSNTSWEVV